MDNKGRNILYALDKNSRASYSQIAKATRISQETVRYRINSMLKEGIIQKFLTILNTTKLGNSYYQIMLKLQNINEERKNEIITFLKNSNKVAWIGDLEGNYDIAFIIYVKNQIELQKLIEELYNQFNKYIMKKVISINLSAEFFPRDYLINKNRLIMQRSIYKTYESYVKLDDIDNKICNILGKDARLSSVDIANLIGISSDSVIQRIRNLKKKEIILGYNIVLNQNKINQSHYKLLLYLNNVSKEREEKLIAFSRMNNRVISIVKTLAEWDFEIDIEVENINQLKQFKMNLTNQFSDIIKDYDSLRIVGMPKYTFYP